MAPHRSKCLRCAVPIEIGFQEVLATIEYDFTHGTPESESWDEPSTPDTWDVWAVTLTRAVPNGKPDYEYLGEAPAWIVSALERDFEQGGPTWEAAREAAEGRRNHDAA